MYPIRLSRSFGLLFPFAIHAASLVPAQEITWALRAPANVPQARIQHAMAYDSQRQRVVLYGGYGGAGLSDTWEWDGSNWLQRSLLSGPQIRRWSGLAYDRSRSRMVLFGGQSVNGTHPTDTWEWNGSAWTSVATTHAPLPRLGHAMYYDGQRQRIVLFGGRDRSPLSTTILDDLWEFDGVDWTQRNVGNGPAGRVEHWMVYDPTRSRAVLFGGRLTNTTYADDVWEFDGNTWQQFTPALMPPTGQGAMQFAAYDASRQAVVAFGGFQPNFGYLGGTWSWDGTAWTQLLATGSPSPRAYGALAYDEARQSLVLFGGGSAQGNQSATYTSFLPASASTFGTGCGSPTLTLTPDPSGRPVLGQSGRLTIANVPGPIVAVAAGWSRTHGAGQQLPFSLAVFGMPGCDLQQSAEFLGMATTPSGAGMASADYPLPFVPAMLGIKVYLQAYAIAPGQNQLGIVVSNGVQWTLGAN